MSFEYNGNLEESKRILQVGYEIINYYPEIDLDMAKKIASLEQPITKNYDYKMHFERLYNILFIMHNNPTIFSKVYNDIVNIYNLCLKNENDIHLIQSMMEEITNYVEGKRQDFPIISEFY